MRPPAPRTVLVAFSALAVSCTINVQNVTRTASSDSAVSFTSFRSDVSELGFGLETVDVRGADRVGGHAELAIAGLLESGTSVEAIDRGVSFVWDASMSPLMVLGVAYGGPDPASIWLRALQVEVPRTCAVDLETDDARLYVLGVLGPVRARTVSGRIDVEGATTADLGSEYGGIDVTAGSATVQTGSSDVVLHVTGPVQVDTRAGRVSGSIEDGGAITCGSGGAIDVTLLGPLTEDLDLVTANGDIVLRVPADASFELSVSTIGDVHVAASGVTFDGQGTFERRIGAGGFRVHARADAGSIRIVDGL